ncbi:cytoplasmic protein [Shewanella sp. Isolate11]|uniref:cytoplasmic protein n=1 Tax=Shewanella sp. Isolate11 TaxID=2908530 RepID=UPI001EFE03A2|nr:cytoplasmic protein [Shewanella sp. Isolate11]MCG9697637.1 cytoplasmic protein [Shewanella sp. Isolate11]
MSISVTSHDLQPNLNHGSVGVKVAQIAKSQQQAEGQMIMQLIEATSAPAQPVPVGNSGHIIATTA